MYEKPRNPNGRAGVPTELKKQRGTFRPSSANKNEPQPEPVTGEIETPTDVLEDAVDDFQYFAMLAQDMGVLSVADIPAMVLLANHHHIYKKTQKIVLGWSIGSRQPDTLPLNLAHKVSRDALNTVLKMMAKFGMTPNDRRAVTALADAECSKAIAQDRTSEPVSDFSNIGKYNRSLHAQSTRD